MGTQAKSLHIPTSMSDVFQGISALTDQCSQVLLTPEYQQLARYAVAALCRSPHFNANPSEYRSWAVGTLLALGHVNFLFLRSNALQVSKADLCKALQVSQGQGASYMRKVQQHLKMRRFESNWYVRSRIASSPGVWMISLEGKIVDARHLPHELQVLAYQKGLIPSMPPSPRIWNGEAD